MKFVGPWTVHDALFAAEKSTFAVTVHWTVHEREKKKKKKRKKTQNADGFKTQTYIQTSTKCQELNE